MLHPIEVIRQTHHEQVFNEQDDDEDRDSADYDRQEHMPLAGKPTALHSNNFPD